MFACMVGSDMKEDSKKGSPRKDVEIWKVMNLFIVSFVIMALGVCMMPKVRKLYTLNTGCSCVPATTAKL